MDKKGYISKIREDLRNGVRHTKVSIENLGKKHGIENKNLFKEFTELRITSYNVCYTKLLREH